MRLNPRLAFLALAALLAARAAAADPTGSYPYVTPFGGYTMFDGWQRVSGRTLRDGPDLGARLGYQWNSAIGLEGAAGWTLSEEDIVQGGKAPFLHGSGVVTLSPYSGLYGAPFLLIGGGASRLKVSRSGGVDTTISRGHLEFGAGLRFWLTDRIGARVEARDLFALKKDSRGFRNQTLIFGVGLTYALGGRPRDSDGDGVPDRIDQHPNTPKGATVDARGVPIDSDGDGVFDGIDRHPNTPRGATIDAFGVPHDSDGDGVFDGLDTCPDTPQGARVDEKGCPTDQDGDGVFDGLDQCADTPAGFPVDEKGCPKDQDRDGIPDDRDKCADTPAGTKVDSTGCEAIVAQVESTFVRRDTLRVDFQATQFATGKAEIASGSQAVLDAVGQVLTQHPELQIEIAGHTDSRGSSALNLRLSEARARAVRDYLVRNFPNIRPERLRVRGYGESRPRVPDTSPENMATNRRVEFVVLNKEAAKPSAP